MAHYKGQAKVTSKVREKLNDKGTERNQSNVRFPVGGAGQVRMEPRDSTSSESDLDTQLLSVCWGVAAWEGSSTFTAEPN